MKVRKKPVVVEAVQYLENEDWRIIDWSDEPNWLLEAIECTVIHFEVGIGFIETLEGQMQFEAGDWVIRGVRGELYACKKDIFEQTYEFV